MSTAESIFQSSVIGLSKSEQLKLAALILDDLSASSGPTLDFSDSWSVEDVHDVAAHAADYASKVYGEEPNSA